MQVKKTDQFVEVVPDPKQKGMFKCVKTGSLYAWSDLVPCPNLPAQVNQNHIKVSALDVRVQLNISGHIESRQVSNN
jgi:hypothetical protein